MPSQFAKPELQTGVQVPAEQDVVPFGLTHAFPQAPQLLASVVRFRQTPPQEVWPAGQLGAHWPFWHVVPAAQVVTVATQSPELLHVYASTLPKGVHSGAGQ